jgi:hypothetical protein
MKLPLQFLDPPAVLPGFHRTGRPRLAETGNRIPLPAIQLRRIQPLLATPGATCRLIRKRFSATLGLSALQDGWSGCQFHGISSSMRF